MRSYCLAFFVLCYSLSCTATTFIILVTPSGIVIGADGKTTNLRTGGGTAVKVFLLKQRLIFGSLDTETAISNDTGQVLYDFPVWAREVDKQSTKDVSVEEFATFIQNKTLGRFKFLSLSLQSGKFTKKQAIEAGLDDTLAQFVIAGYEQNSPTVYWVNLDADWKKKRLKHPSKGLLYPEPGNTTGPYVHYLGRHLGLDRAMTPHTKEQEEFFARVPVETQILLQKKSFSLRQASNVARTLLGIEAEVEPSNVGFPLTIVTVPLYGDAFTETYKTDVFPLSALAHAEEPKRTSIESKANPFNRMIVIGVVVLWLIVTGAILVVRSWK